MIMKIQIRQIIDVRSNKYKIYDVMKKNIFGIWISHNTYFNISDARSDYPNVAIEDLTINE